MDELLSTASRLGREGLALRDAGDYTRALERFAEMLAVLERRAATLPGNSRAVRYVALARSRAGGVLIRTGAYEDAVVHLKAAYRICAREAAMDPTDPEVQRDLSIQCDHLGEVLERMGRADDALVYLEQSLRIARGLLSTAPEDRRLRMDLACSLERVASAMGDTGRGGEVLELLREQVSVIAGLVRDAPDDMGLLGFLASAYLSLGGHFMALQRFVEAQVCLDESLARYRRVLDALPETPRICNAVGIACVRAGRIAMRNNDLSGGLRHLRDAARWTTRAASLAPEDGSYELWQIAAFEELAVAEHKAGDAVAARKHGAIASDLRHSRRRRTPRT